jgi:hypothetical protein
MRSPGLIGILRFASRVTDSAAMTVFSLIHYL